MAYGTMAEQGTIDYFRYIDLTHFISQTFGKKIKK
jgi:hypothetical protein